MAIGLVVSIGLFSNNALYLGTIPKANPGVGDLTFIVGFVIAGVLYYVFSLVQPVRSDEAAMGKVA